MTSEYRNLWPTAPAGDAQYGYWGVLDAPRSREWGPQGRRPPEGGVLSPPDALPDACDAPASRRIGRLSGRAYDAVVGAPYVGFYPLARIFHEAA